MNFYVRRCNTCRAPLEQEPDRSRDYGYPVYVCWDCAEMPDADEDNDAPPAA